MINPQLKIQNDSDENRIKNLGFVPYTNENFYKQGYEYKNQNFRVLIDCYGVVTMSRVNPDTDPIVLFVPEVSDLENAIGQLVD